ncbi:hypothetical protein Cgig2_007558 [Carnegiea gigantea]|uniref:Aminotransferase-like plant mobile domain-containing protein n=1 Tax=Carnegiea gigantea TaxID=171969 RepID=A0A9Q1GQR4_9CARY|nr:hypothetical protein Cgig2_007558 [Carnegiea gigantea]
MIPGKLAVWLVRNFDICSCSLPLTNGRLRVTEHDVYMTLALTKGPLEVAEAKSEMNCSRWGRRIKRNFIVFAVSTCINGNQRGEVNYLVLDTLLDLSKVRELNWARYTMAVLFSSVDEWKKKTSRFFRGPILFLMLCYLDWVVFKVRNVKHQFPTLRGWTNNKMKSKKK